MAFFWQGFNLGPKIVMQSSKIQKKEENKSLYDSCNDSDRALKSTGKHIQLFHTLACRSHVL